ncbi:MAG: hypothetical protein ACRCWB_03890 [Enterovibrio sp.]
MLTNAKISGIKKSVLVPLSRATDNRLQKAQLYTEAESPLGAMSTIIHNPKTGAPVSIARHDWAIPHNPLAVKMLNIDEMFDGGHKDDLKTILNAIRSDKRRGSLTTIEQIERNTQSTIESIQQLKDEPLYEEFPDIVKQFRGVKDYKIPPNEKFVPLILKGMEEKGADGTSQPKKQAPSLFREVDSRFSFSQALKNEEPLFFNENEPQKSTMSYAAAVKKAPLASACALATSVIADQQNEGSDSTDSSSDQVELENASLSPTAAEQNLPFTAEALDVTCEQAEGTAPTTPPASTSGHLDAASSLARNARRRPLKNLKLTNFVEKPEPLAGRPSSLTEESRPSAKESAQTFAQAASSQPSSLVFKAYQKK